MHTFPPANTTCPMKLWESCSEAARDAANDGGANASARARFLTQSNTHLEAGSLVLGRGGMVTLTRIERCPVVVNSTDHVTLNSK